MCILPEKAVPKMTYVVSGWDVKPYLLTTLVVKCSVSIAVAAFSDHVMVYQFTASVDMSNS